MNRYKLEGVLWVNEGQSGWYFITLPIDISTTIKEFFKELSPRFGSLPVSVTVNQTKWRTSIFFDTKANAYLLPIKGEVRKKENLHADEIVLYELEVMN